MGNISQEGERQVGGKSKKQNQGWGRLGKNEAEGLNHHACRGRAQSGQTSGWSPVHKVGEEEAVSVVEVLQSEMRHQLPPGSLGRRPTPTPVLTRCYGTVSQQSQGEQVQPHTGHGIQTRGPRSRRQDRAPQFLQPELATRGQQRRAHHWAALNPLGGEGVPAGLSRLTPRHPPKDMHL